MEQSSLTQTNTHFNNCILKLSSESISVGYKIIYSNNNLPTFTLLQHLSVNAVALSVWSSAKMLKSHFDIEPIKNGEKTKGKKKRIKVKAAVEV